MTVEADFHTALASFAALTTLVGTRIAQHTVPQDAALPIVVYSASHEPLFGLNGSAHCDRVTFTAECWAKTAVAATAVGDQVQTALAAYSLTHPNSLITVLVRAAAYDGDLSLDADVLTIEWWAM